MVAEQLQNVRDEIRKPAKKADGSKEVTLIAVSKTKPISMIEEAMEQDRRYSERTKYRNFAPNTKNFRKISNGI